MNNKPFPKLTPLEAELLIKENRRLRCENEEFQRCVTELVSNYVQMIDDKMITQDLKISKVSGAVLTYHPEAEELVFGSGGDGNE